MYKKFMDLRIKVKLIIVFAIILVMFLGVAGTQLYTAQQCMNRFTVAYNEYASPAQDVAKAYAYLNKATAQIEEVDLLTESADIVNAAKHAQESLEQAKNLAGTVGVAVKDEEIVNLFNAAKKDFDAYVTVVDGIITPILAGNEADVDVDALDAAMAATEESMLKLDSALLAGSDKEQADIIANQNKTMSVLLVIIIAVVAFGVVMAIIIIRSIRIPLQEMEEIADKLALGDIDVVVKKHNEDEKILFRKT